MPRGFGLEIFYSSKLNLVISNSFLSYLIIEFFNQSGSLDRRAPSALGLLQDLSLLYWSELLGGGNVFHWLNNFKPYNTKVNVFPFNGQRHSTGFILFSLLSTMCVHLVVLFHLLDLNRTDFEASNHSLT